MTWVGIFVLPFQPSPYWCPKKKPRWGATPFIASRDDIPILFLPLYWLLGRSLLSPTRDFIAWHWFRHIFVFDDGAFVGNYSAS